MSVTWSDYTFREEQSNNNGAWLESAWAQPHGLVAIVSSNHDSRGIQPAITVEGVEHTVIADQGSVPYVNYYSWPYARWYWYYHPWYYRYYWYWGWHRYMPVNARVTLIVPHESGTIRAKAEGTYIFDHRMRVFTANITPAGGRAIRRVGFSTSIQTAQVDGPSATMDCLADDLLLAIGTDSSPWYSLADIVKTSGPATQELINIIPSRQNMSVRVKLWRVKGAGTMNLGFVNCNAGRAMVRAMPNVEVYRTVPPTITEPRAYFEMQVRQDEVGRVVRPDWFQGLYHTLRNNQQIGLARSWLREIQERKVDTVGRVAGVSARKIEHWTIPQAYAGSVGPEALLFEDRNEWYARVVAQDNQW